MKNNDIMNVGIIGTGLLGKAVATRLLNTGHKVTVYNRTEKKTESLKNIGAQVAKSPKQVAERSDIVITIVKDAEAVKSISFGKDGIIHGKHEKLIVSDMSTISPISSRKIAEKYLQYGIPMIDSPVMGGPPLAEKGQLVVMIGGKKEIYERCKSVFDSIGERTFYLGDNGSADAMKLAMNLQISILALAISEGIILVKKSGLDPLLFLEVLNSTYFKTGMSTLKGPKMAKGVFEPSFFLNVMQKDLDEINYTAKEFGADLPVARLANELYQNAVKDGFGNIDYTGILSYLEKIKKSNT
ncbi:2-hydroxy-3-oxopropionate reductase [Candidatus Nitrosotalea sp. TS]|uniref:NAD(P)-dependent oxidoreductase n=1 Tax=Candidatus Nitrosotalea sp. TS TaxID=2341020 RepID=UPI0014489059|nr:NAD(P)-dependent oxidoreductase [Candidatus Nitrosotalea sp. TS]NHI02466.1 2-hydroxy-3-oxopropionate reductase [Candidatus Nitrosotalea sp. TS]